MRNMILVVGWIVLALGALAGCNKSSEQASDETAQSIASAATAGGAEVQGGAGQPAAAGGEGGSTAVIGGNATLPQGWPGSLPQYPGSKIVAAYTTGEGQHQAYAVNLSTSDSLEQVLAFYEEKALAAGYNKLSSVSSTDRGAAHYSSGTWKFNVTCTAAEGNTGIMLALGTTDEEGEGSAQPADGEGTESGASGWDDNGGQATEAYIGALPEGFPVEVVKPYPGAEIDNAASRGKEHLLTMTTKDASADVIKFYESYFGGRGWTKKDTVDADNNSMRGFQQGSDEVVLTAALKDGGTFITLVYTQK